MDSDMPQIHAKNNVLGVSGPVFDPDLLLDTQEVTGSSPVSPIVSAYE